MASKALYSKLLILLFLAPSVFCLKCYVCNSAKDEGCAMSSPPDKFLVECSHDTLEILNDMHRQTKLEEAAAAATQSKNVEEKPAIAPISPHGPNTDSAGKSQREAEANHADDDAEVWTTYEPQIEHPEEPSINVQNRTTRSAEPQKDTHPFVVSPVKVPKEAILCRKTSYYIPEQVNGPSSVLPASVRVIRSCGYIAENNHKDGDNGTIKTGCKWIGEDAIQYDQCVCSGDGCNTAGLIKSLKIQTVLIFTIIAAGYYYVL